MTLPTTTFRLSVASSITYNRLTIAEGTAQEVLRELDGSSWADDPDPSYALQSTAKGFWGVVSPADLLGLQKAGTLTGPEARLLLSYVIQAA